MASPQSENKSAQRTVVNYLRNGPGWRRRVYLFATTAALLILIISNKVFVAPIAQTSSHRVENDINGEKGLLEVTSRFKNPMIIVTLRGYPESSRCTDIYNPRYELSDHRALVKLTVLSDSAANDDASIVQVGQPQLISSEKLNSETTMWTTYFHVDVKPPSSDYFPNDVQLCYTIDYRVEYTDLKTAMADFPPEFCSYQGSPKFHRIWENDEFNTDDQNNATPWLLRKNYDQDWEWIGIAGYQNKSSGKLLQPMPCSSWKQERPYSIVIIGDSQPFYMCNHLIYGLTGEQNTTQHPKVRCVGIKGVLQNSLDRHASELQHASEDIVIFNPSILWEAAYGSLDMFRHNFEKLLTSIPTERNKTGSIKKQYYFFAPTTAVHPINYPNLSTDTMKWSMTQPRVRAINKIATDFVSKRTQLYNAKSYETIAISILPAPWDSISLSREDDPMTSTDMRHFNVSTNEMLLTAMFCKLDQIMKENGE